jgi:probable rRNA maturation factor
VSFYLEEECKVPFDFDYEELAAQVVAFCLEHEHFPYEAEVNLTLTDNAGIHVMNSEYRQIDRPTDVLSFPMLTYESAGDFRFLERESEDDFNPDTGEAMLGDIIISVEKVMEQAESFGHSVRREFAFLIVHSMLHLFGYDHIDPADAAVMEPKQREILEAMNILREEEA